MTDAIFAEPRLADVYDDFDTPRSDLDAYVAIVEELGARSVLDIGCGTGTFACRLAQRGLEVVGLDPAEASLAVARRKLGANRVRWIAGDVSALPSMQVDLVTMTGNVAQVFLTDADWTAVLASAHAALRPKGHLVFETRDPEQENWRNWTRTKTERVADITGTGTVRRWYELVDVKPPLVSFRATFVFDTDGTVMTSDSTLRFRGRTEIRESLTRSGLAVQEVRDAPDRPGLEMMFLAQRAEYG